MTAAAHTAKADRLSWRLAALPAWGWWALAFAVIAVRAVLTTGQGMSNFLGDMDDATRLVAVREFMNGAPWFDTTTMTMGGTGGMLSHWSRLIDLPIAAIIAALKLVMPVATAELVARAVWPLIVLAPLLWTLQQTVTRVAGQSAGAIALALTVLCPLGLYQFDVGRIDHHNVMIAATVSAALLMWANPASLYSWRLAGALSGLSLVIGFEALAPAAALAVFAALWGLVARGQANPARGFTIAMMLTLACGFLLTIPPSRWMDIRCDAISLNLVALSTIAGSGLITALSPARDWSVPVRFAIAGAGAVVGLIVYGALEPKCLAGPMGQLPAELKPVWLDYVAETRSILRDLLTGKIEQSLGLIAFFAIGIAAQAQRLATTRKPADLFLLAATLAFTAFACWQYKYISYASFLAIAPIACWIATLRGTPDVSPVAVQAFVAVLMSQAALLGVSARMQKAFAAPVIVNESVRIGAEACETNSAVRDLAALPPGLIAARIDLGAYVTAVTPHRVLSAPYHRIADAIIANHHIFASRTDAEAARLLAREKIDYVVTCKGLDDPFVTELQWQGTLRANLVASRAPAFLEPVTLDNPATLFRVWRVRREALNLQP
ncbi:MAG: hypothetical protein HOP09_12275 [Hyphomicrobium sp.]|nr:hypothetical protein [Hyphomicrobium sp.]